MTGIEIKKAKEELEFVKDRFYDFPAETGVSSDIENIENAISAINELEEYYTIGLVDECREAREKQTPKKPDTTEDKQFALCPSCNGKGLMNKQKYCDNCGQSINWS